jgi:hypothetical protein
MTARNKLTRAEDGTNVEFRSKNRPDTRLWGSIVISTEHLVDVGECLSRYIG